MFGEKILIFFCFIINSESTFIFLRARRVFFNPLNITDYEQASENLTQVAERFLSHFYRPVNWERICSTSQHLPLLKDDTAVDDTYTHGVYELLTPYLETVAAEVTQLLWKLFVLDSPGADEFIYLVITEHCETDRSTK